MKTFYIDAASIEGCWGVIGQEAQILQAGTTVYSMPVSDKNEEYERWAREYDIHFIFEDDMPRTDFYAVPRFDVLAVDSMGGYIGTIGACSDLAGGAPVGYIDARRNVFLIAQSGPEFLNCAPEWRKHLAACDEMKLYPSKAAAERELEFIQLDFQKE